jgi:ATP-dependent DNA ligase
MITTPEATKLSLSPGLSPMEARLVDDLPAEPGWQFEPKWDGFRCLAFRAGDQVELRAKSGKPLSRYFPEMVALLGGLEPQCFVLDGELVIPLGETLSFDALQMRLHPAESRIRRLANETPAVFIAFDLLARPGEESMLQTPLAQRRPALEAFYRSAGSREGLKLSPATCEVEEARQWLEKGGGALDGVIAKRLDGVYQPGERAMLKIKKQRTADCVVGGVRYERSSSLVGSLLLGLYNNEGKLDHVGFTATLHDLDREALTHQLERLIMPPGFTGNAPGGPSRWSTERSGEWEPLRPELVVEVRYDHFTGGRFRHGTRFLRWRPDKAPRQCTFDQVETEASPTSLVTNLLEATTNRSPAAASEAGDSRRSRHRCKVASVTFRTSSEGRWRRHASTRTVIEVRPVFISSP